MSTVPTPSANAPKPKGLRIELIDALRGFALASICIVHFMEQFLASMPPAGQENYSNHGGVDGILEGLAFLLIRGKGFAMFSFMFGLSFALQVLRKEDGPGKGRFAWRLCLLFGIGLIHSSLYRGDILTVYALLGLPLLLVDRLPDKVLLSLAFLLLIGTPRIAIGFLSTKPTTEAAAAADKAGQESSAAHFKASKEGPFSEAMRRNLTEGIVDRFKFQFGDFSRGYQTFAYFLLGLIAGRSRWFEELEARRKFFKSLCLGSLAMTLLLPAVAALGWFLLKPPETTPPTPPPAWLQTAGLTLYDVWNVGHTFLYISLFTILFQRPWWNRILTHLTPYGRMGLTNYLGQSLVGGLVFFSIGLGQLGNIGNSKTLAIALGVIAVQIVLSRVWLKHFRFGPIEWAWRCLTRLKSEPLRRAL